MSFFLPHTPAQYKKASVLRPQIGWAVGEEVSVFYVGMAFNGRIETQEPLYFCKTQDGRKSHYFESSLTDLS